MKKPKKQEPIIIQELVIVAPDRSMKDLRDFKIALKNAESIYYPNRTKLYDLYEDIILDGHLSGLMNKRMEYVLNKKLHALDKSGKDVKAFDDLFSKIEWREMIKTLLEVRFWGISGFEFIPGQEFEFEPIPRKHINLKNKIISKHQQAGEEGIDYTAEPNLWVIGKEKDFGMLLPCAPYALWKRGNLGDWAQFIEIFGQPLRIAKYDGFDKETKVELKKALDQAGSSLALMIPKQADIEIVDGKSSNATGELQDKFRRACNDEMSVVILGNTETTTSSSSSGYAQSRVHGEQQADIHQSDRAFVTALLNSPDFLTIIKSYGYPTEGITFKFEDEKDIEYLASRIEVDTKLAALIPMDDDYFYNMYDVPKPANYDQLKKQKEQQAQAKAQAEKNPDEQKPDDSSGETVGADLCVCPKKVKLSAFDKFREALADFFDRAPLR